MNFHFLLIFFYLALYLFFLFSQTFCSYSSSNLVLFLRYVQGMVSNEWPSYDFQMNSGQDIPCPKLYTSYDFPKCDCTTLAFSSYLYCNNHIYSFCAFLDQVSYVIFCHGSEYFIVRIIYFKSELILQVASVGSLLSCYYYLL